LNEFQRAVELDPNFAAAWAVIASTMQIAGEWDAAKREDTWRRAKQAAMRALQIDESIAEAHSVLGWLAMFGDWDLKEASFRFSRAVELEPRNPELQRQYAAALSIQERHDDAAREIERAELSDPGVSPISAGLAEVYFLARRHAEARQQARRAITLNQENSFAHWLLAVNSQLDGDIAEAEREYKWCLKKYSLDSRAITGLAHLRARQKQYPEAQKMMDNAIRQWGTQDGWNCSLALVSWEGGDAERARKALQRCMGFRDGSALFVLVDPRYDGMRQTPEYQALLGRVKR
jgi:Tfp pilus assembly protein PilF